MRLNKHNFKKLAELIEELFPTFKVPKTKIGIAIWIEDLAKYDMETIFIGVKRLYRKEQYFNYSQLLKEIDKEATKGQYDYLITNRNYELPPGKEKKKITVEGGRLDFENRSGKLEKANFDKLLENVEVIND